MKTTLRAAEDRANSAEEQLASAESELKAIGHGARIEQTDTDAFKAAFQAGMAFMEKECEIDKQQQLPAQENVFREKSAKRPVNQTVQELRASKAESAARQAAARCEELEAYIEELKSQVAQLENPYRHKQLRSGLKPGYSDKELGFDSGNDESQPGLTNDWDLFCDGGYCVDCDVDCSVNAGRCKCCVATATRLYLRQADRALEEHVEPSFSGFLQGYNGGHARRR